MFTQIQPLPPYRVCPNSGALIFQPNLADEATINALAQIQLLSNAMLKASEALNAGQPIPEDAIATMRSLGR